MRIICSGSIFIPHLKISLQCQKKIDIFGGRAMFYLENQKREKRVKCMLVLATLSLVAANHYVGSWAWQFRPKWCAQLEVLPFH